MTLPSCFARFAALGVGVLLGARRRMAQRLSDRTIFIVVPFTPGTGIDVLARIVGEELRQRWNQAVVIEQQARRERQHRHAGGRARRARRPHHHDDGQHLRHECEPVQEPPL